MLVKFMGYDLFVYREYYRFLESILEVVKVVKIFYCINEGKLLLVKDSILDEF